MMGIPPQAAETIDLWEYEALLHHWNESHGGGEEADLPDREISQAILDRANSDPRLTGAAPAA